MHLKFCKTFLSLNRKASNHAARTEMGRFPLQITIIKQLVKYYLYLDKKNNSSLMKQALHISEETGNKLLELLHFVNLRCIKTLEHPTQDVISRPISLLYTVCTKTFGKIRLNTLLRWTFTKNSKRIL